MTALSLNAQIDDRGRGSGKPLLCGGVNRDHRPARLLLLKRQDDDLPQLGRGGMTRPGRFSRGWFGHPDDITNFRTRTYAGLTAEQVAALLEFNPPHHVACKLTDGSEHVERLSSRLVYGNNHSEAPTHAAGSITQGLGNV